MPADGTAQQLAEILAHTGFGPKPSHLDRAIAGISEPFSPLKTVSPASKTKRRCRIFLYLGESLLPLFPSHTENPHSIILDHMSFQYQGDHPYVQACGAASSAPAVPISKT